MRLVLAGSVVPSFVKLQSSYFRIQLLAKSHKLVEGQALGPSLQLAAKLY